MGSETSISLVRQEHEPLFFDDLSPRHFDTEEYELVENETTSEDTSVVPSQFVE